MIKFCRILWYSHQHFFRRVEFQHCHNMWGWKCEWAGSVIDITYEVISIGCVAEACASLRSGLLISQYRPTYLLAQPRPAHLPAPASASPRLGLRISQTRPAHLPASACASPSLGLCISQTRPAHLPVSACASPSLGLRISQPRPAHLPAPVCASPSPGLRISQHRSGTCFGCRHLTCEVPLRVMFY